MLPGSRQAHRANAKSGKYPGLHVVILQCGSSGVVANEGQQLVPRVMTVRESSPQRRGRASRPPPCARCRAGLGDNTTMRSASVNASSTSWVTKRIVLPVPRHRSMSCRRNRARVFGSVRKRFVHEDDVGSRPAPGRLHAPALAAGEHRRHLLGRRLASPMRASCRRRTRGDPCTDMAGYAHLQAERCSSAPPRQETRRWNT